VGVHDEESLVRPYQELEAALQDWTGMHVSVCNTGTAALHLALEALCLPPGSAVAVPNFCFAAVPRAVKLASLVPVFIGCGEDCLMDCDQLEKAIVEHPPGVAAVAAVHTYGRLCDMERIHKLAYPRKIAVVEDMAEAHGCRPHPLSLAAAWSFQSTKIVHGEEGGAAGFQFTCHKERADLLRTFGNLGDYSHVPNGNNYRLADSAAELIHKSLLNFDKEVCIRRRNERSYDEVCPTAWKAPTKRESPWMYDFRMHGATMADQVAVVDEVAGLRHGFKLMTQQEEYRGSPRFDTYRLNEYSVLCAPLNSFKADVFNLAALLSHRRSHRGKTSA
jgi:perosamine synthetase